MTDASGSSQNGSLKLILGLLAAVVIAALVYVFYYKDAAKDQTQAGGDQTQLADNVMGKEDAPVTIIEFSSMTCPHCAIFHKDTLPGLKSKYIDTGKVKYILREFPLDPLAGAAFMLGRCLPKKDSYFDFIDVLYARQNEWANAKDPINALKTLAKQAGFTDESFKACLDDKELYGKVLAVNYASQRNPNYSS